MSICAKREHLVQAPWWSRWAACVALCTIALCMPLVYARRRIDRVITAVLLQFRLSWICLPCPHAWCRFPGRHCRRQPAVCVGPGGGWAAAQEAHQLPEDRHCGAAVAHGRTRVFCCAAAAGGLTGWARQGGYV
eukprot:scaffold97838_cov19-Tisochrysis_lutea.AAC.2